MKRRAPSIRLIVISVMAGCVMSACGIKGDLLTPPPLWGEDIRTEAQKAEVERAKSERAKLAAEKAARDAKKAAEAQK